MSVNVFEKMGKGIDNLSVFYSYFGLAVSFIMGCLLAVEAISSKFGYSTVWIMWGCIHATAILPFCTAAWAMKQYQHVRVAFFEGLMAPRTALVSQIYGWCMFFLFCLVSAFYLSTFTWDTYKVGETSTQVSGFPMWPFYFVTALGCWILVLQTIRSALLLTKKFTPDLKKHDHFWGSPVFVIAIYVIATVLSVWSFVVIPPIGVFVMLLVFLFTGLPVASAIGLLTLVALYVVGGFPMFESLGMNLYKTMEEFTWFAFPMFVLGGFMMQRGMASGLFRVMNAWIGFVPGGVAVAVIWTGVLLAAMLGSAYAALALLIILGLAELDKAGYPRSITLPLIASTAILGPLIPPSTMFVALGALTDTSVGALFMAGIGPGITIAVIFTLFMMYYGIRHPEIKRYRATWKERFTAIPANLPALSIPIVVTGTIAIGFFTPTEAAAFALLYIWIVNLLRRDMKVSAADFKELFTGVSNAIGFIGFIVVGAFLSRLALMHFHVGEDIVKMMTDYGLGKHSMILMVTILLFLMGCIGETLPIVIVLIPTVFPVLYSLGIHPWWICVYLILMGAIGGLTPPVGGLVFGVAGMTNTPTTEVFRSILPWAILFFVVLIILYIFPELVTYIPTAVGFTQ
jgi:C4-dicarboxylate transporter DctM subunit